MQNWKMLVVVVIGLMPITAASNHPDFYRPTKVILHCVEAEGMNYNLRSDPTSRRSGDEGEILFQYQICRSA